MAINYDWFENPKTDPEEETTLQLIANCCGRKFPVVTWEAQREFCPNVE